MKTFNIVFFVSYPEKFISNCDRQLKYYADEVKKSGILNDDRCTNMYIVYTYEKSDPINLLKELYNHDKVIIENFDVTCTDLKYDEKHKEYPNEPIKHPDLLPKIAEYPGIKKVHSLALNKPDSYVYYFHLKGITHNLDDQYGPADWIEYLLYYTMENYKLDLEQLDKGHAACGVDFLEGLRCCPYHYSGNFWWVDSNSLIKTEKEPPSIGSKRLDYEFYILECFRQYKKEKLTWVSLHQSTRTLNGRPHKDHVKNNYFIGFASRWQFKKNYLKFEYDLNNINLEEHIHIYNK